MGRTFPVIVLLICFSNADLEVPEVTGSVLIDGITTTHSDVSSLTKIITTGTSEGDTGTQSEVVAKCDDGVKNDCTTTGSQKEMNTSAIEDLRSSDQSSSTTRTLVKDETDAPPYLLDGGTTTQSFETLPSTDASRTTSITSETDMETKTGLSTSPPPPTTTSTTTTASSTVELKSQAGLKQSDKTSSTSLRITGTNITDSATSVNERTSKISTTPSSSSQSSTTTLTKSTTNKVSSTYRKASTTTGMHGSSLLPDHALSTTSPVTPTSSDMSTFLGTSPSVSESSASTPTSTHHTTSTTSILSSSPELNTESKPENDEVLVHIYEQPPEEDSFEKFPQNHVQSSAIYYKIFGVCAAAVVMVIIASAFLLSERKKRRNKGVGAWIEEAKRMDLRNWKRYNINDVKGTLDNIPPCKEIYVEMNKDSSIVV